MGRGLVDPVDDFRSSNPASHLELLEALAKDFAEHGCDLRRLIRTITSSRAYQLASEPNETNDDDETNHARGLVTRLTAEQPLDSICKALAAPLRTVPRRHASRAAPRRPQTLQAAEERRGPLLSRLRQAAAAHRQRLRADEGDRPARRRALEDFAWALLNSKEFVFRR